MPTTPAVRVAIWSALAVVFVTISGCGTRAESADASLPPRSVVAGAKVAINPDRQRVLAAYAGYLDAETSASQHADYASAELTRFMDQPLLGQWVAALYHLHAIGYKQVGSVISAAPRITSLDLAAGSEAGTAVVTDCLDETGMSIVDATTGKPMKLPAHSSRYQTTATLHLRDGIWRVYEVDADRSRTC